MCGIAGLADLKGARAVPHRILRAMAEAIVHRGPDEDGYLERPGLSLASRRLSIVGLSDGRQPIANESGTVHVVFNGELFDYPEKKRELEALGHRFRTHCDTELIPHLWEEHGLRIFEHLKGQFAFALWDEKQRRLVLARDRLGICPLYWTVQHTSSWSWLLFASEIKSLLSSGMVSARPDVRGIDQAFTFFALPGPITCFEGVQALLPGHYLDIAFGSPGEPARISDRTYWEIDFPDRGSERPGSERLIDDYERLVLRAVETRLRADVPVVSYLSGGVDSSLVLALASKIRGEPVPAFTIRVKAPGLDELAKAETTARHVGTDPTVVPCGMDDILSVYPRLVSAAECPVSDTCCAALLLLAQEVHRRGFKVALTGEGADETLAGYPWIKWHHVFRSLDAIPKLNLGQRVRHAAVRLLGLPPHPADYESQLYAAVGGNNAWLDLYGLVSLSKPRFYGPRLRPLLGTYVPYADLGLNVERMRAWHPINQSLYLGQRIHLPGLLLSIGGDRVAMHSSVETRYPFLDEDVVAFLAQLEPRWKLRGLQDKFILRRLAERYLPKEVAWRPKAMFRTPWDVFNSDGAAPFVRQLLTPRALKETGYFDPASVCQWLERLPSMRPGWPQRALLEQSLTAVAMTQLWHHMFIDDLGADAPHHRAPSLGMPDSAAAGPHDQNAAGMLRASGVDR